MLTIYLKLCQVRECKVEGATQWSEGNWNLGNVWWGIIDDTLQRPPNQSF